MGRIYGVASQAPAGPALNLAILSPGDGLRVDPGTPITFAGQASKTLGTLDQSGQVLHQLPGTGWTEIAPGQWQNLRGDVEQFTWYKVTDPDAWAIGTGLCQLWSTMTEETVAPGSDYWVCDVSAYLPGQAGFRPPGPDLSDSIEWYTEGGKIGEGAQLTTPLGPGFHIITARLSHGGLSTERTISLEVNQPADSTPPPVTTPDPGPGPTPGTTTPPATSTGKAIAPAPKTNWLWLLLLLALLYYLSREDKDA